MDVLGRTLRELKVGEPVTFRNLTVFPLFGPAAADPGYMVLDDAVSAGHVRITEVNQNGSVPELKLVNDLSTSVLVLDGEELVGAKQNRVANLTILAPPQKAIKIPVSCVEEGRWHHTSPQFAVAQTVALAGVRVRKARDVSRSLKATRGYSRSSNQGALWQGIAKRIDRLNVSSDTYAMDDIFAVYDERIQEFCEALQPAEGQVGACFAIAGKIVGLELFDAPTTFAKLLPKLVRSYALDALEVASAPMAVSTVRATGFIQDALMAKREVFPAIGEGEDLRFVDDRITGGALLVRGRVVHAAIFDPKAEDLVGSGGLAPSSAARSRGRVLSSTTYWPDEEYEEDYEDEEDWENGDEDEEEAEDLFMR
ncbi:MAG: ARPP-1 family domain-containing protein [Chthonomonadales bacterium]